MPVVYFETFLLKCFVVSNERQYIYATQVRYTCFFKQNVDIMENEKQNVLNLSSYPDDVSQDILDGSPSPVRAYIGCSQPFSWVGKPYRALCLSSSNYDAVVCEWHEGRCQNLIYVPAGSIVYPFNS